MNPLDRNHDGKVNLNDLKSNTTGMQGTGMQGTGLQGTGAHHNPLDKNHDGRVDARDFTSGSSGVGMQGMQGTGAHHNPMDRNHDGRVDARDFAAGSGVGMQGGAHHNPLDRNHDGRVNSQDFTNAGLNTGNRSSIGMVRAEPTRIETVQKEVVVHERIHPVQKEEIQPVIYREREQLDIKQVTQMMHETQIQPTLVQQRELPAQTREAVVERGAPIAENYVQASREVDATMRSQVVHAPIVNEVIKKTVIEEIQPVLERDIITSTVIQNTQPIYEKFVEAPQVYREVRTVQDRGVVGGDLDALRAQGFNIGGMSGQTTTYTTGTGHHNPMDRNHDGRVDARDFAPNAGMNSGLGGEQLLTHHGLQGSGMQGTGLQGTGLQGTGMHGTGLQGTGLQGTGMQGTGLQGAGAHHNPLDRNHDGKVGLGDLTAGSGTGMQGTGTQGTGLQGAGAHHNPLDRNHDGKVGLGDLTGRPNTNAANTSVGRV